MAETIEKQAMAPSGGGKSFYPFIFGNDVDSVDIATRVAMVSGPLKQRHTLSLISRMFL